MRTAICILTALVLLCYSSSGQGTLKGKIVDTAAKQPLALATVTIFKAADTALITYRLSNPDGEFRVPSLPFNTECRVVISFSGYAVYRKTFTLTQAEPQLDLA
ncbi:MAG: carboxypeptidase regulatory-like domain-containing protein, partial [Gemmatimonadaceae bacterium]|nr:carboxypeptidase regulatory-like domain-containing protein [Chitinophagaceae bacterium]